jgi:hypothetical protein
MLDFTKFFLIMIVAGTLLTSHFFAADNKTNDILSPGSTIPSSFSPLVINGNWKDRNDEPVDRYHSVVCRFGLKPVVLVFARDPKDEVLFEFLKKLEGKIESEKNSYLSGCAIFLGHDDKRNNAGSKAKDLIAAANEKEKLIALLKEKAKTAGLKQVLVGIDTPAGPRAFHIKPRADVTVIIYHKFQVVANRSYERGGFDEKAAAGIFKEVDALLARIAKKPQKAGKK